MRAPPAVGRVGSVVVMWLAAGACSQQPASEPFACQAVPLGDNIVRECTLRAADSCSGTECIAQVRAHCFWRTHSPDWNTREWTTANPQWVCSPTPEECSSWREDEVRRKRDAGPCISMSRADVEKGARDAR